MKKIIFYHPHDLLDKPNTGSEVRPKKMKEAFENIGFEVSLVVGGSLKRKRAIKEIRKEIKQGKKFEFLYGESSNMPVPFADSHHFPVRPLQDFLFFRFLQKNGIPIGFFYRDIFWRVKELRDRFPFFKWKIKRIIHWIEWYGLKQAIDHLFIPTERMSSYLPNKLPKTRWSYLYPGCSPLTFKNGIKKCNTDNDKLKLFYVGGIEPTLYNLEQLLQVVSETNGVYLKLCCRKNEWEIYASYYSKFDLSSVEIIHANSLEIEKHYKWADLFMCLWPSEGYINVTMPIKIIETVGYEVPLVLLSGSESADFVKRENAGWVVQSVAEAKELLKALRDDKNKIAQKVANLQKVAQKHTWEKRAEKVSRILSHKY